MDRNRGFAPVLIILLIAVVGIGAYFLGTSGLFKQNLPRPSTTPSSSPSDRPIPVFEKPEPIVLIPSPNSKIMSPLAFSGIVPPGWAFEGVFPIKLVDADRKMIAKGQGKEKTPGAWQNGKSIEFKATITFTTTAKTGFIILENDNPSGDPAKAKTFEIPVTF